MQFAPQVNFTLALAHGDAYSTPVKNPVFVRASVFKVSFSFSFALGTFGFVLALVQAHFSGYAAVLCGLGSNAAVNADGLQQPVTLVR